MLEFNMFTEILKQSINGQYASGNNEIAGTCPFCGGSRSGKPSFYIKIVNGEPMVYNCFRANCGVSGLLNKDALYMMGIFDIDSLSYILQYNNKISKDIKYKNKAIISGKKQLLHNINRNNETTKKKLEYINNRLGYNFTLEELDKLKITLDLVQLLKDSRVKTLTRHPKVVKEFSKYFIGFISQDNCFVNLRNIFPDLTYSKKRYENYNIYPTVSNMFKSYIIPTSIDITKKVILRISEGEFDMLSIYKRIPNSEKANNIFCAVTGAGFAGVIKDFIINKGIIDIEAHLYLDNDMEQESLDYVLYILSECMIPTYTHNNIYNNKKDFGVHYTEILEKVHQLN